MFEEPFTYYPAPPISVKFQQGLTRIGGLTPNGLPMFRIVWGMDEKWVRNGEIVPRYVGSTRENDVERTTPGGLVLGIERVFEVYGKPRWIIEEWHDPNTMGPSLEIAEADWQKLRYRYSIGAGYDEDGNPAPVVVCEDVLGTFPKDRYKYVCTLETSDGQYAQPSEWWLEIIRETLKRRNERKFTSVEAEIADLEDQMLQRRKAATEPIWQEAAEDLALHAHRLIDPARANKGGSRPGMIILPGN